MLLEVFAKEGLGREVELLGNLLDAQPRELQQVLGLHDDGIVDPAGCGLATHLLDGR